MEARRASFRNSRIAAGAAALIVLALTGCADRAAPPTDGGPGEAFDQGKDPDSAPKPTKLPWVTTFAGQGCSTATTWPDGPRLKTEIAPYVLALGPHGELYFIDNNVGLRVVEGDQVRTIATLKTAELGGAGLIVLGDGRILNASFWYVQELKDGKSKLLVGSKTEGGVAVDGSALAARFIKIEDIALDAAGRLLIADRYSVRLLDNGQVTTIAGNGYGCKQRVDGPVGTATFCWLRAVVDSPNGIVVADETTLRQVRNGQVSTLGGAYGKPWQVVDGPLDKASFTRVRSMAWKKDVLYLVDWTTARRIRYLKDKVVYSLTDGQEGFKDGYVGDALFDLPMYLVVDSKGNLLISDVGNCRIRHVQLEP